MVCSKCGYQNSQGTTYCSGCGKKLSSSGKRSNIMLSLVLIMAVSFLIIGIGYFTIHDWSAATCTELSTCSICGRTQGGLLDHQWPENTKKKLMNCLSCGKPNGSIIPYNDYAVESSFTDQEVFFSLDDGKEVGCSVIKLHKTVYNCTSVTVNLEITELRKGNVQGEWGFYVRDVHGKWSLADTFELEGDSSRFVVTFEEPISFDAWACPCHVLGDSWDFNFSVWLSDPKVFHYSG